MFYKSKSPETFISKPLDLTILNQNILYLTHTMDKCLRVLKEMQSDKALQKQVDDYFEDDNHSFTDKSRTSPQTDSDSK